MRHFPSVTFIISCLQSTQVQKMMFKAMQVAFVVTVTSLLTLHVVVAREMYNQYTGVCYSYSYAQSFFIKPTSLDLSSVMDRQRRRSFLECCVTCDVGKGCSGVAYRDGECSRINASATQPNFVLASEADADTSKVWMHDIGDTSQVRHHCLGNCEQCSDIPVPTPNDCKGWLELGETQDGIQYIKYSATVDYPVFCDMSNGGWTVIQRRVDDSTDFSRGWDDYVAGFGDPAGNVWAGLDRIHALTSGAPTELYVTMETFEGQSAWARYSSFTVGDDASGYLLTMSGYSGTAGDSMTPKHSGMKFSTYDNDQDKRSTSNCAVDFKGGWWYNTCHDANPNGLYLGGPFTSYADGVVWSSYKGIAYSLKMIEFKVKRV